MRQFSEQDIFDAWAEDMELDILNAIEDRVGVEFAEALSSDLSSVFNSRQVLHLFDVYLEYNYEKIEIEENTYFIPRSEDI